jgi:hypothetical protein
MRRSKSALLLIELISALDKPWLFCYSFLGSAKHPEGRRGNFIKDKGKAQPTRRKLTDRIAKISGKTDNLEEDSLKSNPKLFLKLDFVYAGFGKL